MSKANFNESRKIGVELVSRDASGNLLTWRENGYDMAVARDASGNVTTLTASGPAGSYKMTIQRDAKGNYIGQTGDYLQSAMLPEIIGGGGNVLKVTTSPNGRVVSANQIPVALFSTAVPFILPAGDGGTNGLSFNGGGGGAFTFSAAPLAGLGSGLVGFPCFFYLPSNAGGSGCAAGWYYGSWSNDTAGVIYADRYTSGNPSDAIPKSPAIFAGSPSGRITQSTSTINAISGVVLPSGSMGVDGELQWEVMTAGDASGVAKNFFWNIGGSQINREQTSVSPITEKLISIHNAGVLNKQVSSKWGRGISFMDASSPVFASVDTAIDNQMSVSMSIVANTGTAVLMKTRWIVSKKG